MRFEILSLININKNKQAGKQKKETRSPTVKVTKMTLGWTLINLLNCSVLFSFLERKFIFWEIGVLKYDIYRMLSFVFRQH